MPIQPADPELRRRALIAVILVAVLGSAALLGLQYWLTELQARSPQEASKNPLIMLRWCVYGACALLVGFAIYLWQLARDVSHDQRFPPLRQRVVRDTPVLEATAALQRARLLRVFAVILVLSTFGLLIVVSRLTATIGARVAG